MPYQLIRFHAIPNVDLEGTDMESMLAFRDYLTQHGVFATIRASRGEDIFAACGMLSTAKRQAEKIKKLTKRKKYEAFSLLSEFGTCCASISFL